MTIPTTPESTIPTTTPPVAPVVPPPSVESNLIDTNTQILVDTNIPPPPRVVSHEGYVRGSVSPVAPTYFELFDPSASLAINYLFSTTTNLNLARYDGLKVVVTGEEGLDLRWKKTPVLTIQKIYVLPPDAEPPVKRVASPRASKSH